MTIPCKSFADRPFVADIARHRSDGTTLALEFRPSWMA